MKRIPRPLDPTEIRVLGALLEKEQTTPDHYPLTENSLLAACNQKSNRDPVMSLTETEVADALDRLFVDVLVWKSTGPRAVKWEQNTKRRWGFGPPAKAVMTLLMLRGPQTVGELRGRSGRMHSFDSTDEVEEVLRELAAGHEPMVVELGRQAGQKEARWAHLLAGPIDEAQLASAAPAPAAQPTPGPADAPGRYEPGLADQVTELAQRVEQLESELAMLKSELGLGGGD